MPDEAAPDIIETRDADRPRRRWPWVVAGVTLVAAVAAAILVPILHRYRAAAEVRQIAAVWADRGAVVRAIGRTFNRLEDKALASDRPLLESAGRALQEEVAARLQILASALRGALVVVPSVRGLRSIAVAALDAEITERRELATSSEGLSLDVSDEVSRQIFIVGDRLSDARDRWDVATPPLPEDIVLHAADNANQALGQLVDSPLPYVLVTGYSGGTLLNLSTNSVTGTPKALRRKNLIFSTPLGAVFHTWRGEWEVIRGDLAPKPVSDSQVDAVYPASEHTVWALRYRAAGSQVRALSLNGGAPGAAFRLPHAGPAGGVREGVVVTDQRGAGLTLDNTGDFAAVDRLSRLVLVNPDGEQRTIAQGCNEVLLAQHAHVLWVPCHESRRPRLAHLTDVRTTKSVVLRSSVGQPRRLYGLNAAAGSPDGRWLAVPWGRGSGRRSSIGIVDTREGKVRVLDGPRVTRQGIVWSPDSRHLFFTTPQGLGWWDSGTGTHQLVRYRTFTQPRLFAVLPVTWFS